MNKHTAAITGAGSGIGRAIAEAFVTAGYEVFASDVSQGRLDETLKELGDPANLHTRQVDVSDYESMERFVEEAASLGGTLDVMISCAGVFDGYADVAETTPELW